MIPNSVQCHKYISHLRLFSLWLVPLLIISDCPSASANAWKASIVPASINSDGTIKLVGGEVQDMVLALQADHDVTSRSDTHRIMLEWDLPSDMAIMECFLT